MGRKSVYGPAQIRYDQSGKRPRVTIGARLSDREVELLDKIREQGESRSAAICRLICQYAKAMGLTA